MSNGWGGSRANCGRKGKSRLQKELEGDIPMSNNNVPEVVDKVEDIPSDVMIPKVKDYMKMDQRTGKPLGADLILNDMINYLKKIRCLGLVNPMLVEQYAMDRARYIQCQNALSEYGLIIRKQSNGNTVPSPFYTMLSGLEKSMNNTYYMIDRVIRDNCKDGYHEYTESEWVMERILTDTLPDDFDENREKYEKYYIPNPKEDDENDTVEGGIDNAGNTDGSKDS